MVSVEHVFSRLSFKNEKCQSNIQINVPGENEGDPGVAAAVIVVVEVVAEIWYKKTIIFTTM